MLSRWYAFASTHPFFAVLILCVIYLIFAPPRWTPAIRIKCRPGYPHGMHGDVIYGLGGMGDASLCLRCGLDTYGRIGLGRVSEKSWHRMTGLR